MFDIPTVVNQARLVATNIGGLTSASTLWGGTRGTKTRGASLAQGRNCGGSLSTTNIKKIHQQPLENPAPPPTTSWELHLSTNNIKSIASLHQEQPKVIASNFWKKRKDFKYKRFKIGLRSPGGNKYKDINPNLPASNQDTSRTIGLDSHTHKDIKSACSVAFEWVVTWGGDLSVLSSFASISDWWSGEPDFLSKLRRRLGFLQLTDMMSRPAINYLPFCRSSQLGASNIHALSSVPFLSYLYKATQPVSCYFLRSRPDCTPPFIPPKGWVISECQLKSKFPQVCCESDTGKWDVVPDEDRDVPVKGGPGINAPRPGLSPHTARTQIYEKEIGVFIGPRSGHSLP